MSRKMKIIARNIDAEDKDFMLKSLNLQGRGHKVQINKRSPGSYDIFVTEDLYWQLKDAGLA